MNSPTDKPKQSSTTLYDKTLAGVGVELLISKNHLGTMFAHLSKVGDVYKRRTLCVNDEKASQLIQEFEMPNKESLNNNPNSILWMHFKDFFPLFNQEK